MFSSTLYLSFMLKYTSLYVYGITKNEYIFELLYHNRSASKQSIFIFQIYIYKNQYNRKIRIPIRKNVCINSNPRMSNMFYPTHTTLRTNSLLPVCFFRAVQAIYFNFNNTVPYIKTKTRVFMVFVCTQNVQINMNQSLAITFKQRLFQILIFFEYIRVGHEDFFKNIFIFQH